MLILRLLLILAAIAIVLSGGMYVFTNDRRYLRFAWQLARFVLFAIVIAVLLFVLERYVLVAWRILI